MGATTTIQARLVLVACVLLAPGSARGADAQPGKPVYTTRCAFCHGLSGTGDGPAGAALKPPPTDFTSAEFWKRATPETIRAAIADGKPGTAMIAFKDALTAAQLNNLVAYVQTFKRSP